MQGLVIFSDLDGTLLDHATYEAGPALPVLARLRAMGVPLVLATSKTGAEVVEVRARLGLAGLPAIVENGAGLWTGSMDGAGRYGALRALLDALDPELRGLFQGFGDWSVDEVARRTGLGVADAARAKARQFTEPGLFNGDAAQQAAFLRALAVQGVSARQGGRFLTLSFGGDKADRMAEAVALLGGDADTVTLALGDAPNDVGMFLAADFGAIVANPAHAPLPEVPGEATGRIRRTHAAGPAGFAEAVTGFLDRPEEWAGRTA